MLNLDEINATIDELESNKLTFDVCQKLASLYIIKNYYENKKDNDIVITEYNDILPSYHKFCELKRKYQLSEISEEIVYKQLKLLCTEISEFIQILFNNTDNEQEREIIKQALSTII